MLLPAHGGEGVYLVIHWFPHSVITLLALSTLGEHSLHYILLPKYHWFNQKKKGHKLRGFPRMIVLR